MFSSIVRRLALSVPGLLLSFGAQAGAVSLDFDPAFGPALPNVQYSGDFNFSVSDGCLNGSPVVITLFCGGPLVGSGNLTLSNTASGQSLTVGYSLNVYLLFVTNGFVTGWLTDSTPFLSEFRTLTGGKDFTFDFENLPALYAYTPGPRSERFYARSSAAGLDGIVSYVDDAGNSPLGRDSQGNNIAYRITVGADGTPTYTPTAAAAVVPEPGSLALVAVALAGAGWVTRRRRLSGTGSMPGARTPSSPA